MLPLLHCQKISFAQAAALTGSVSHFSFLRGGVYIGCSRWFKHRAELRSIWNSVWFSCACSFLRYLAQFFILSIPLPYLSDLVSPALYTLCLANSNSSTTFTVSFFILLCPYLSPSLLLFHCLSGYIYILPTITFQLSLCFLFYLPSFVALYSRWTGPMDSKCAVCERMCVNVWEWE